jgi:hypothetical protein
LLVFALIGSAHAQSEYTNACTTTTVVRGGFILWSSTYSVDIKVAPAPGTTWPLTQSYLIIPANGQVGTTVPMSAQLGTYETSVVFDTESGGNVCAGQAGDDGGGGTIKIQN